MKYKTTALIAFCAFLVALTPICWMQSSARTLNVPILSQVNITSIKLVTESPSQFQEAEQLRRQGDAQLKLQEFQAALQYYQRSIQILKGLKVDNDQLEEAFLSMAKTYLLMGDNPKALALFRQLAEAKNSNNEPALTNLGLALFRSGKLLEAEQVLQKAISGWEKRRNVEEDDLAKITKLEQQTYTYRLLQKVLVQQQKTDAALLISEQMRGRSLLEQIVQNAGLPATPPPNLEYIRQIARNTNSTLVEYSIVGNEIHIFGNEPDDETELLIWVVQPNGTISFRQVDLRQLPEQSLTNLVLKTRQESLGINGRGAVGVVSRPSNNAGVRTNLELQKLGHFLIDPIDVFLPKNSNDHVIFIPYKSLFLVPFPALQNSTGKYLIEQHTLISASSIQVLALTNQQRSNISASKRALVVGNPTMPTLPALGNRLSGQLDSLPGAEKGSPCCCLHTQHSSNYR